MEYKYVRQIKGQGVEQEVGRAGSGWSRKGWSNTCM